MEHAANADAGREAIWDFSSLAMRPNGLPPLESYEARDGARLFYRHYPSQSDKVLILLHGTALHGVYLHPFAQVLSAAGAAQIYVPELRGHGHAPIRRGDIDYIDQLEDDLADLIIHIRGTTSQELPVVIGGHSSGGGLAVRFAGGRHRELAAAYLLLAPYLGYDAPTVRANSGGWAEPNMGRIIPITILNQFGITRFNGAQVLRFHLPEAYRGGQETLAYSYRLTMGFGPRHFTKDLRALKAPLLLIAGASDEALVAAKLEPTVRPLAPQVEIKILDGLTHLGLMASAAAATVVGDWLDGLPGQPTPKMVIQRNPQDHVERKRQPQ